jgi:hypothetical protein
VPPSLATPVGNVASYDIASNRPPPVGRRSAFVQRPTPAWRLLADSSVGKGGGVQRVLAPWGAREEDRMMKLAKRILISLGSLAALALAGGAHYKL